MKKIKLHFDPLIETPGSGRKLSHKELFYCYGVIRGKHGDDAGNSKWMSKNGYGWIIDRMQAHTDFEWDDFKGAAGFVEPPLKMKKMSLKKLIKRYREVRDEHGDDAGSSQWLSLNGYRWLYRQVKITHRIPWGIFKSEAGYKDDGDRRYGVTLEMVIDGYKQLRKEVGPLAKGTKWLGFNGHSWIVNHVSELGFGWPEFKKLCGFDDQEMKPFLPIKELLSEYGNVRRDNGDKACSARWISDNGFRWIYWQVNAKHKLRWEDFVSLYEESYNISNEALEI